MSGKMAVAIALILLFSVMYLFAEVFDFIWRTQR